MPIYHITKCNRLAPAGTETAFNQDIAAAEQSALNAYIEFRRTKTNNLLLIIPLQKLCGKSTLTEIGDRTAQTGENFELTEHEASLLDTYLSWRAQNPQEHNWPCHFITHLNELKIDRDKMLLRDKFLQRLSTVRSGHITGVRYTPPTPAKETTAPQAIRLADTFKPVLPVSSQVMERTLPPQEVEELRLNRRIKDTQEDLRSPSIQRDSFGKLLAEIHLAKLQRELRGVKRTTSSHLS